MSSTPSRKYFAIGPAWAVLWYACPMTFAMSSGRFLVMPPPLPTVEEDGEEEAAAEWEARHGGSGIG